MTEELTPTERSVLNQSMFVVEKESFKTEEGRVVGEIKKVSFRSTPPTFVAASREIFDPIWHRWEIFNWMGHIVYVAEGADEASSALKNQVNLYIKEELTVPTKGKGKK